MLLVKDYLVKSLTPSTLRKTLHMSYGTLAGDDSSMTYPLITLYTGDDPIQNNDCILAGVEQAMITVIIHLGVGPPGLHTYRRVMERR